MGCVQAGVGGIYPSKGHSGRGNAGDSEEKSQKETQKGPTPIEVGRSIQ